MSYNLSKALTSEYQSPSINPSIKIEDIKINPINPVNSISTKEGS